MNLDNWIRQPTNIHALAVIAAGAGAALAHVATGNQTIDLAVAAVSYLAIHLGINDNSALEQDVTGFLTDLQNHAPVTQTLTDATKLVADGQVAFAPQAAPVTTQGTNP